MSLSERIQTDLAVCHGQPVIRDTRVPVSIVLGSLAGGMSMSEIVDEYGVTPEDIQAALNFASDLIARQSCCRVPPDAIRESA
ncbi:MULTISPECIES: DUF433 domain-containing protein [Thiorhodovibrio]|uniref:DUF433 domain-containing protein n=1 Tax=Thiorhodovibrio TaxID=61593 RepID=UPI001913FBBF|nr:MULTISPECIES: DUF433 domain-containing protein [Thiorhodovibrio]MBK5968481.1 hypothetical protein [Thiorhodovibrio winogradskyi]WPL11126.1 hypothetical protein Thiosp_00854 [Thiorhodovibrio litoralis]